MKKNFFYAAAFAVGLAFASTACGNNDAPQPEPIDAADIDYTSENAASWNNYMKAVVTLLRKDASDLYDYWAVSYKGGESYATTFKNHGAPFNSAGSCVQQVIDGCVDIANEVGETKIGDPYSKYQAGNVTEALYAVESWYSWHSREDYSNNIVSICNAICGVRSESLISGATIDKSQVAGKSLYTALVNNGQQELADNTLTAIKNAYDKILAIPQPFRNHINSEQSLAAQEACSELSVLLKNQLKPACDALSESVLSPVVANYVDVVVLPTYADLKAKVGTLYEKVNVLAANPTNQAFKDACDAWITAREPWEMSEAFLFGPVADQGLDPNMDSWPLDQAAIVNILNSGDYSQMEWSGDYSEDSESISAAQNVRGFHTLEFLLFKDGQARSVD